MSTRYAGPHGVYHIAPLPNMPQVAWCYGFWVPPEMRGNGHGRHLEEMQAMSLKAAKYDYAITTTAGSNIAKQKCLLAAGWTLLDTFDNSRTGEPHQVWGRPLHRNTKEA